MEYTYPNAIFVDYTGYRWGYPSGVELRKTFTVKSPGGVFEFTGTYTEARDHFRNQFPAKSIVFRHNWPKNL